MTKTKTNKNQPKTSALGSDRAPKRRSAPRWLSWSAILLPVAALSIVAILGTSEDGGDNGIGVGATAPEFALPATDGTVKTLTDYLDAGPALLYFSMGPGCDGCFLQIPEIEEALDGKGISLVPVMVDEAPIVDAEAKRFGITSPILIDSDRSVADTYGMLGIYGHSDRPSHSFALVDREGRISWVAHYAEMFVPVQQLIADMEAGA